jgi:hypothetical protein
MFVFEAQISYEKHFDFRRKKQISMDLIFDLLIIAFFGPGDLLVCHSEL